MQQVSDIKSVHIELTDKCQAQCPMCARNFMAAQLVRLSVMVISVSNNLKNGFLSNF
jgi:MoaA/NifB/PqqE/SkfB family radical SAM enzyme